MKVTVLTNEQLSETQQMAEENNILLPTGLNVNVQPKLTVSGEDILLPTELNAKK